MEKDQDQLEALKDIRQMMKESSRFLSLSGISGVLAGIYGLIGAALAKVLIDKYYNGPQEVGHAVYFSLILQCFLIAGLVLFLSLATAVYFSHRKAKRLGTNLFDHTARRLLLNMFIPLATGGVMCIALFFHGMIGLLSPVMLIFYGLALVNGSKYTLHDIRALGCMEIILGLIACFYMAYGLILWAIGFGLLHIIYGAYMWYKYERN